MNSPIRGTSILVGLLGLISAPAVQAQTTSDTTRYSIDTSDQARFVENLETRSHSDWTFGASGQNEALVENSVEFNELEGSEEDVELVNIDEEFEDWENTGDDEDSAVIVDVYDF